MRRDLEISFFGPSLLINPLGEREIGFAPVPLPHSDETVLRADFDPYNSGRPIPVLKRGGDDQGLHLPDIHYQRFASPAALAGLLRETNADRSPDFDGIGKPLVEPDALPAQPPYFAASPILSIDESPLYFRYAGRVYVLGPLQPASKLAADVGVYELPSPTQIKRRCLFRAHMPMAYYPYDAPGLDGAARAEDVVVEAGPLLPGGKLCEAHGDGPRTLWDHETYRPWVLEHRWWSVGGIDPPGLARYLRNRGLTGLEQNRAFRRYVAARDHAIGANSRYYIDRFARPAAAARQLAALDLDWSVIDGSLILLDDAVTAALLAPGFEDRHALQAAAFAGDEATVKTLLGADAKETARHATRPLDEPLLTDALEHSNLVRALLGLGFDPNETGASGRTPLMIAARFDLIEAARLLLERGANVNAEAGAKVAELYPESDYAECRQGGEWSPNDTPGRTALSYAAELASSAMVRLLLDHGADPHHPDSEDKSPAAYVSKDGGGRSAQILELLK